MYKNLRSKCFIKDLWCSPKILTRCIAKQLYGEKKRREYNCRKSVGTRAGLRDSRYSRTANTVHCTGEERNTERQILGGTTCTIHWHQHWQGGANVQSLDFKLLLGGSWGVLALVGWGASGGWEGQQRKRQLEIWRPPKKTFLAGGADVIFFNHVFHLIVATSSSESMSFTQSSARFANW